MKVREYFPGFVSVPEDSPFKRPLTTNKPSLAIDESLCDRLTLFTDTIWIPHHQYLVVTAPRLKHLSSRAIKFEIVMGTKVYRGLLKHFRKVAKGRVRLPGFTLDQLLTIRLPAHGISFNLKTPTTALGPVFTNLVTLQKNNPPEWIRDWVRYHLAIGINRIFLYDNGSENIAAVREALNNLPANVLGDIHLVHWPMRFGDYRHSRTMLAQTCASHHAMQLSAGRGWLTNLDIDEYIVPSKNGLDTIFPRNPLIEDLKLQSYSVLNTSPTEDLARAETAIWRHRIDQSGHVKHWMRLSANPMPGAHSAGLRFPFLDRVLTRESQCLFHYRGLNTGWKESSRSRQVEERPDPNDHVEDTRVADVFSSLRKGVA